MNAGPPADRSAGTASSRRTFLAGAAATAALATGIGGARAEEEAKPAARAVLPTHAFGKKPDRVTRLGLGCFPAGGLADADAGVAVVRRALEGGVTYLDTAPSYSGGKSESRVGIALEGWPREKVFLATKTLARSADDARRDLEGSLQRLRVQRVDLLQVHAVQHAADLERILASDGPLAALVKARDEGLLRYIGVTGHADPLVVRQTFQRWPFDSVLFPLNCVDPHHRSFVKDALPAAVEKGLARIAMKVYASGHLLEKGLDPARCLRYVLGLDITTAIVGMKTVPEVELALRVAADPKPLTAEEVRDLLRSSEPHAGKEWYKRP